MAPERAHAGAAARSRWCASRAVPRRRCATGCRCICISAPRTWSAVPRCSAGARSPRARPALCRSTSNSRSARCRATAAVLRDHAARHTLAGGRVVDPFAPRRGRRRPERLAVLAALADADPAAALERLLAVGGRGRSGAVRAGCATCRRPSSTRWPRTAGFCASGRRARRSRSPPSGSPRSAKRSSRRSAAWHQAQPDALGPAAPGVVRAAARRRRRRRRSTRRCRRSRRRPGGARGRDVAPARASAAADRADERLWERVRPLLAADGSAPAAGARDGRGAGAGARGGRALSAPRRAARAGSRRVADNRFFLPETVGAPGRDRRASWPTASPRGQLYRGAFKDRSGIGRNLTIEVLEYLDRIGATRRVGDARIVLRDGDRLISPAGQDKPAAALSPNSAAVRRRVIRPAPAPWARSAPPGVPRR